MNGQTNGKDERERVFRRRTPPGAMPGSILTDPEAPYPELRVMVWSDGSFMEKESVSVDDLSGLIEGWPLVWINVDGLGDAGTLQKIGEMFGIHKLALEDVVHVHQRAKVEGYEDHLFIVARMLSSVDERVRTEQISLFLLPGIVLTFQEQKGDCLEPVRERIRKGKGRIRQAGADYLTYAIIDAVVDAWFPLLEDYGEMLEDLEDRILDVADKDTVAEIHRVKRDLLNVRRAIWPLRETINGLSREESLVQKETLLYLRDCYDHVTQIIEIVESYRDMASGLMDLYLSSVSNRMNEIMKVLTVIATIFIPLTFIAGIYGMNFNPGASPFNMPELNWRFGYIAVWLLMLGVGGVMLLFFRRLGWLGGKKGRRK
jgi:magnesium transporter